MTEKKQGKLIEVIYGRGLALLFSLALALFCFCAAPSWAQMSQSGAKASAHAAASAAKAPATRAKSRGGNHEGITVHGWWKIEVKDPDGKVVSHTEFENNLAGPEILYNLLLGTFTPQAYGIELGGTDAAQTPANQPAPCLNNGASFACEILENLPPSGNLYNPCSNPTPQFAVCTLTRTPSLGSTVPSNAQGITFQGSIIAAQPGYIGAVTLFADWCQSSAANGLSALSPADCSGGNYTTNNTYSTTFTQKILTSPVQIQAAGQTVAASVQITFQ